MQDNVDQVLKRSRPGDRPVLGYMSYQYRRQDPLLGQADQRRGDLAHLGHAAWRAFDPCRRDGLDRVDDQQRRLHCLDVSEQRGQVSFGRKIEILGDRTDPVGSLPYLSRRLLAGDVQNDRALGGKRACLEQQRRLADARFACQQRDSSRYEAAAENPVKLVHAGRPGSPQRPAHLVLCQPHSEQANSVPAEPFAMPGTVSAGSDSPVLRAA